MVKKSNIDSFIICFVLLILIVLGLFLDIPNVHALNVPYWGYNSEQPIRGNIYSLGSNFSKTDISIGGFADNNRYYIWNSSENVSSYIGTQGVALQVVTPTFKTDMYYNVNMYVCSRVSYTTNAEYTWHTHNADILANNQAEAIYNTWKGLSATPFNEGYNQQWGHCAVHSAIIRPTANGMFLDLRIRHTSGQSSADNLAIIGYDVTPLARTDILTRSDVENIVRNSGLATATDVEDVQRSVDKMREESQEYYDKVLDENDKSGNGDTFDNSGISSNDEKEEDLLNEINSSIDNFDVDLSSNSQGFEYYFYLVTSFVQSNAKVFGLMLVCLSFGFIKMVLGR